MYDLDYNIRMYINSFNKFIQVVILLISLSFLYGCGNKGPLKLPESIISLYN